MRAFPKGIAAPVFLLSAPKTRSEFDFATGRLSWHERWAQRMLGLPRKQAAEFWSRLLPALVEAGLLSVRTPTDGSLRVYGLKPGAIDVQLLKDAEVNEAFVRCPDCFWEQTVHPGLLAQWDGQRCPSYRCRSGILVAGDRPEGLGMHQRDRDYREDYYRGLYRKAGTYQVITAEHTGMLTRPERERVEAAFKDGSGFKDPNVLSCTPTLEMGIDIGDLSAVVLAALPRRAANYAQQVGRAGRRTGNAFLLTIPDRSRRDLYYLDQPREMIAGQIVPPGSHLSAIEILRRQYLAHLLDLAARGGCRAPTAVRCPRSYGTPRPSSARPDTSPISSKRRSRMPRTWSKGSWTCFPSASTSRQRKTCGPSPGAGCAARWNRPSDSGCTPRRCYGGGCGTSQRPATNSTTPRTSSATARPNSMPNTGRSASA